MVSMKMDERQFVFVGNNLAIDFVNTQIIDRGEMIDLLNDSQDFVSWARAAELPLDSNNEMHYSFEKCLALRKALKQVFTAVLDTRTIPASALNTINQHLLNHATERELKNVKGKLALRSIYKSLSVERLFGLIANEAAELLESNQLKKLKKCANPTCILLFVDTSKSGRRRWCRMNVCGNRSKAASYYHGRKGVTSSHP